MVYKLKSNRVWRTYLGGKRIDSLYGKSNPKNSHYPEDWIASTVRAFNSGHKDTMEGLSICQDGQVPVDLIRQAPEKVLGRNQVEKHGEQMSILVKLLDASERLAIQAHPTIEFSKQYLSSDFGKTECWYIVEAESDAYIYLGFKEGVTRRDWVGCFEKQDVAGMLNMLHKIPVKVGDFFFVDGGIPHAIGGGCMMVELQEPTDFMVIPERITPSGIRLSDTKMHMGLGFEKMFDCFNYEGWSLEELKRKYYRKISIKPNERCAIIDKTLTDKFRMEAYYITDSIIADYEDTYLVAIVIEGKGNITTRSGIHTIAKGDQLFISAYDSNVKWQSDNGMRIVLCMP